MSLRSLNLKSSYKSLGTENIIDSFLIPAIKESIEYKRSVGYFTVQAFIEIYDGIEQLLNYNDGNIKLITSPKLLKEDYEFLNKAYELKEKNFEDILLREFEIKHSEFDNYKIAEVFKLIIKGKIDLKIAVTNTLGMYHDKLGILKDQENNIVAFYGSPNETKNAYTQNYERIRLSFSWSGEQGLSETMNEDNEFNSIWNNTNDYVKSYGFPSAVKERMIEFVKHEEANNPYYVKPEKKSVFTPRDYQIEAVNAWQDNDYRGILSMATGTGKTLTAIYALNRLLKNEEDFYCIIVTVPYNILVEQWKDELVNNGFDVVCVSSEYNDWLRKVQSKIKLLNERIIKNFIIVVTIGSLKTERFNRAISRVRAKIVFIGDEVHHFGAFQTHKYLPEIADYRLGLSATPKRHFDDIGNNKVEDYFNKIIYEFDLKRAINEKFLVPYDYYPILIYLTHSEQEKYNKITERVIKLLNIKNESEIDEHELNDQIKMQLINRSRIIASAVNKIPALFDAIKNGSSTHDLVYCGSSSIVGDEETSEDDSINRQIDLVITGLSERNIWTRKYTSECTADEKRYALNQFIDGNITALVAIKCLDEGVNIPNITRAFIMASSTNPKEFIQRRGRVLRKAPGKEKAYIYDFVVLPLDSTDYGMGLVKRELFRFYEFMILSDNEKNIKPIYNELVKKYNIEVNNE